jgi:hypothetical protein
LVLKLVLNMHARNVFSLLPDPMVLLSRETSVQGTGMSLPGPSPLPTVPPGGNLLQAIRMLLPGLILLPRVLPGKTPFQAVGMSPGLIFLLLHIKAQYEVLFHRKRMK